MFDLKRNVTILLMVAAGGAGLAACGGGGDDEEPATATTGATSTETAALTKADLIDQGNAICSEVNAAVGTIESSTTSDESIKTTQISSIYSGLAEKLQDLGTPSDGDAPTAVIEAAQGLAESTDIDGATALETFQSAASDYGLADCADAPAAPATGGESSTGVPADPSGEGTYVPPTTTPVEPTPAPVEPAPVDPGGTGGVAPSTPDPGTGGSGGSSSGGISPG